MQAGAIRRLDTGKEGFEAGLLELLRSDAAQDSVVREVVSGILASVRDRGDAAVLEYTQRFDRLQAVALPELEVPRHELFAALEQIPGEMRAALETAAERIRSYHQRQLVGGWEYREPDGTVLGQRVTALDRVGIYVPGGRAAYPSSVLMNAIPAKVAGVAECVMVVPAPAGERNPGVLAAAAISGVERVFTIGGAQAIAALAYGTPSIPKVDKIVGPGNAYVAEAKRQVFGVVGIDMIAGPSEVLIICDGATHPDWVALDLFSQAEHDDMAQALLVSPDGEFLDQVEASIRRLLPDMVRRQIIGASLQRRGALIRVRDLDEACALANRIAPEHLELSVAEPRRWLDRIRHAGAIFLGPYSSESLGDYCAGPSHVLPTSGTARFSSPLGVHDFQKRTSIIEVSQAGAQVLGAVARRIAEGEGLGAHACAAGARIGEGR